MIISNADDLRKYLEVLKEFWLLLDDKVAEKQMPPAYLAVSDAFLHFISHRRLLEVSTTTANQAEDQSTRAVGKSALAWGVINEDFYKLIHDGLLTTVDFVLLKNSRKMDDLVPLISKLNTSNLSDDDANLVSQVDVVKSHHNIVSKVLKKIKTLPEGELPCLEEISELKDELLKYTEMENRLLKPSIHTVISKALAKTDNTAKIRQIGKLLWNMGLPRKVKVSLAIGLSVALVVLITPYRGFFAHPIAQFFATFAVVTLVVAYLTRGNSYTRTIKVVIGHLVVSSIAPALANLDIAFLNLFKLSLTFIGDTKLSGLGYAAIITPLVVGSMWRDHLDNKSNK